MTTKPITITAQDKERITQALRFLAGRCDLATSHDGAGFNKFDAQDGHLLSAKAPDLTEWEFIKSARMLVKYRRQIEAGLGFTTPKITKDTEVNFESAPKRNGNGPRAWIENGSIWLVYGHVPNPDKREAMKQIPGWRFNGDREDKAWSFPATERNSAKIAEIAGVAVDDSAEGYKVDFEGVPLLDALRSKIETLRQDVGEPLDPATHKTVDGEGYLRQGICNAQADRLEAFYNELCGIESCKAKQTSFL